MSMKYRALSSDKDYMLGKPPTIEFLKGREAVAQAVLTRLNLLQGEWWESLDDGLPLFQQIVSYRDKELAEILITERILETIDVMRVNNASYDYNPNARSFKYSCDITTRYGEVYIELQEDGGAFYKT